MRTIMFSYFLLGLILSSPAQTVVHAPENTGTLTARWEWAMAEARAMKREGGVWIGYSIERLMGEDSWIGSFNSFPDKNEKTLYEVITGRRIEFEDEGDIGDAARKALSKAERRRTEKKVIKEVVLLFEFRGDPSDVQTLRTLRATNITLSVDLDMLPLLWLGKAGSRESVEFLKDLLGRVTSRRASDKIVQAVGLHGNTPGVFEFLRTILKGDGDSHVREEAAFWIGQLDTAVALPLLVGVARTDESRKVSEKAIFSISQMSLEQATDALIDLGRNGPNREVRKKAVFWLGQKASHSVVDTLQDFAFRDSDEEVQKQAVFALTQLPPHEGVPLIIRIAKTHPNPRIRKQAIFWLGESEDPRAFDTIVEIARGK